MHKKAVGSCVIYDNYKKNEKNLNKLAAVDFWTFSCN